MFKSLIDSIELHLLLLILKLDKWIVRLKKGEHEK